MSRKITRYVVRHCPILCFQWPCERCYYGGHRWFGYHRWTTVDVVTDVSHNRRRTYTQVSDRLINHQWIGLPNRSCEPLSFTVLSVSATNICTTCILQFISRSRLYTPNCGGVAVTAAGRKPYESNPVPNRRDRFPQVKDNITLLFRQPFLSRSTSSPTNNMLSHDYDSRQITKSENRLAKNSVL